MPVTRRSQSAEPEPHLPRSRGTSREPVAKRGKPLASRRTLKKRDEATPVSDEDEDRMGRRGDEGRRSRSVSRARSVEQEQRSNRRSIERELAGGGGGGGGGGAAAIARQYLAPVAEESESTPARPLSSHGRAPSHIADYYAPRSTPGEDEMGTQLEVAEIDPTIAIENLSDLNTTADRILKLLNKDVATQFKDLSQPDSTLSRRLKHFNKAFAVQKSTLGNLQYLSSKAVELATNTTKFTPVVHKANFAVLAVFLNTCQIETEHAWEEFKSIDREFPHQIGMVIDGEETFQLALDMRMHTVLAGITKMPENPEAPPRKFIRHFFFEESENGTKARLRPWPGMQYEDWGKKTRARIRVLMDHFTGDDVDVYEALQDMQKKFPWVEFANRTAQYINRACNSPTYQKKVEEAIEAAEMVINGEELPPDESEEPEEALQPPEDAETGSQISVGLADFEQVDSQEVGNGEDDHVTYPDLPEPEPEPEFESEDKEKSPEAVTATSRALQLATATDRPEPIQHFQSPAALQEVKKMWQKSVAQKQISRWEPKADDIFRQSTSLSFLKASTNEGRDAPASPPPRSSPPLQANANPSVMQELDEMEMNADDDDDDDSQDPQIPPASVMRQYGQLHSIHQEKNKENRSALVPAAAPVKAGPSKPRKRFIDPQDNATKISFDSHGPPSPPPRDKGKGRKRPAITMGSETEDDFVEDARTEQAERRKRSRQDLPPAAPEPRFSTATTLQGRESGATGIMSPKRRQPVIPRNELVRLPPQQRQQSSLPSPQSDRGGGRPAHLAHLDEDLTDDELPQPPSSFAERLRSLNAIAKVQQRPRPRRGKKEWTHEEENRLVELIGIYGPSWKLIENQLDPILEGRTNVQLKDKALSMKVIMLRNKVPLPYMFNRFNIRQKDRDQLKERYRVEVEEWEEEGEGEEEEEDDPMRGMEERERAERQGLRGRDRGSIAL